MAAASLDLALLACPGCRGKLVPRADDLACGGCGAHYTTTDGIPRLVRNVDGRTAAVRDFYSVAPFPGYPPRDNLGSLRARAERSEFARLLDRAIPGDARIVEVGCGTGQMSLYLATARRVVIGADVTRASLVLATRARERFGIRDAFFVETDLQSPGLREGAFDVVYSSGVLHHTPDPRASFAALARLARPGGFVVLGLYNAYARLPHRLRRAVARLTRMKVIPFDPVLEGREAEPERREAWLRDQYHHPEEHRHTIAEVQRWFHETGVEYLRSYPSSLLAAPPVSEGDLFSAAEDDWSLENVVSQIGWAKSLAHEGGLFVTVGRRRCSC